MGDSEVLRVAAITLDFGNTLVRVDRPGLRGVVEQTADALLHAGVVADRDGFLAARSEERDRQFREEVPQFREVDIDQRAVRVLARQRGMAAPPEEHRWDDRAAAAHVRPGEIEAVIDAYSAAFVDGMRPVDDAADTMRRLHEEGFVLGILSNWPLAVTIDRFAKAQGWTPFLRAIVVSQRVGTIKPHPSIFRAAEVALGIQAASGAPTSILHVGDDWAADVVGATRAGWRTAYLQNRQADTPLPTSEPGDGLDGPERVVADLVIDELADLVGGVALDRVAVAAMSRVRG
ncbi:MAG TPA: HAD family hydrolase [Candidatus Limnocylindria bacterium]|nr:HAD family hydrolase [Candidatus Limnocylindria bacterium]